MSILSEKASKRFPARIINSKAILYRNLAAAHFQDSEFGAGLDPAAVDSRQASPSARLAEQTEGRATW